VRSFSLVDIPRSFIGMKDQGSSTSFYERIAFAFLASFHKLIKVGFSLSLKPKIFLNCLIRNVFKIFVILNEMQGNPVHTHLSLEHQEGGPR
jgi:hypothetical protein